MTRQELEAWIERYERAWRTAGTDSVRELFTPNASYSPAPFAEPIVGLQAIERLWEAEREGPGEAFTLEFEIVAVEGPTGVARVEVRYGPPREITYRDLWIVTTDEQGLCTRFEEWPFWPESGEGSIAGVT